MTADDVIARANEVFGDPDKAAVWLDRPNRALSGSTPRSLLSTSEGVNQIETLLGRIEHGVYS